MFLSLARVKLRLTTKNSYFSSFVVTPFFLEAQTENMTQVKMERNWVKTILNNGFDG